MDCVLYEDFTGCVRYELESGAVAMTNISGCDPAALKALTKDAVDLLSAEATVKALGKHSALMLPNTAAVGNVVYSDLELDSIELCFAACDLWIDGCTHVAMGTSPQAVFERRHMQRSRGVSSTSATWGEQYQCDECSPRTVSKPFS
jgi:hypothetical protein